MCRRFRRNIAAAILALGVAGCTTPHHSNALIFGTNTSFGIDVGSDATGTPAILVGYRRQEAVFMPLVASVAYDANGVPTPCAVYPGFAYDARGTQVLNGRTVPEVPPCFLVGQNGGSLDSYSVLASFGAQFSASAANPTASGGLAQFFATGIAAQALAIRGGPALVAVGEAARATGESDTSVEIAALYNSPEVLRRVPIVREQIGAARENAWSYLRDLDSTQFAARFSVFAERLGIGRDYCQGLTKDACLQRITERNTIQDQDADTLNAAVDAARNAGG